MDFDSKENLDSERFQKIEEYRKAGYLFHGSKTSDLNLLEPRVPSSRNESNKEEFDNKMAVFASNNPQVGIFGCISKDDIPNEVGLRRLYSIREKKDSNFLLIIPERYKPFVTNGKGYLYVCPRDGFINNYEEPWQYQSENFVKPIDCTPVYFSDFEKLGGEIKWMPDEEAAKL